VKANVKMTPHIANGVWSVDIRVKTERDIIQNGTLVNPMNPERLNKMERSYEAEVKERIEGALDELQHRQKADIVGLATAFHRKYPKQWAQAKDRWDAIFPTVKTSVTVHAHIIRPGLINAPGGYPRERIKEKNRRSRLTSPVNEAAACRLPLQHFRIMSGRQTYRDYTGSSSRS
jgi:spore germination protein KC